MKHNNPSILAIDIGTQTGWALLTEGKVVSGTFDMSPRSKNEKAGIRFLRFRKEFLPNFKQIREIYYEEVRRHEGTHAAHIYGGFWAILCSFCEENSIPLYAVEVSQWKQSLGCKGNASKADIQEALKQRGVPFSGENEADALGILSHARKNRGA